MILPLIKQGASCDYHRLVQPLKRMGIDTDFSNDDIPNLIKDAKIVIFNRWAGFPIENLLRTKKIYGFKIVCDLDDYFNLGPHNPMYNNWNKFEMSRKIKEALMNSDFVLTSTKRLALIAEKFNKKVEVVPNGLAFDEGQFSDNTERSGFNIVYVAGTTHMFDLLTLKNLFYKISRETLKYNVSFTLAGYTDKGDSSKIWKAMESIMSANGRLNYSRKEGTPIDNYMDLYNGSSLAIAPLESGYFNRFKSNLKILEAGCKNMPIITSAVPPYSDEDTDLVLKAHSNKEWYDYIKKLSDDREYANDLGLRLGSYVRENYNLDKINIIRKQVFQCLT